MCVIVNKNRGIELPRKELLENCFSNNSDGAGMMYNLNGKVYIEKGFMKFDEFYNRLMELDKKISPPRNEMGFDYAIPFLCSLQKCIQYHS